MEFVITKSSKKRGISDSTKNIQAVNPKRLIAHYCPTEYKNRETGTVERALRRPWEENCRTAWIPGNDLN